MKLEKIILSLARGWGTRLKEVGYHMTRKQQTFSPYLGKE